MHPGTVCVRASRASILRGGRLNHSSHDSGQLLGPGGLNQRHDLQKQVIHVECAALRIQLLVTCLRLRRRLAATEVMRFKRDFEKQAMFMTLQVKFHRILYSFNPVRHCFRMYAQRFSRVSLMTVE